MNGNPHPVFKKIFEKSFVKYVDSSTIGFTLGPIFNSSGRIDNPNTAVELLTQNNIEEAQILLLMDLNAKRKELTKQQFVLAEKQIIQKQLYGDKVIVVFDEFHNGIIGIIAARIAEKYKKPSIVISSTGTGSARSGNGSGFSIINVINKSSELLLKHGGHQGAAGLSIAPEEKQIDLFRNTIQLAAESEVFNEPVLNYISKLDICDFSEELFEDIRILEPYGINIPKPLFYCDSTNFSSTSLFGRNNEHLKIHFRKNEAIAFFKGSMIKEISNKRQILALYSTFCNRKKNFLIHSLKAQ
jgi:single-stranded-DNA-specific exonuclease